MKFDFKNILVGILIGVITTTTIFLMVGEVETEIKIGSSTNNEKVAILFSEKDEIEIINLDEAENITINVQEDKFDFKIYSNDGSETEELLSGKTLRIKYPEGLLDGDDVDIKLVVIN
tara:strand:- start:407 stop:760 length:354 start_codon:yes stop_codon:yes gene_type:complete